MTTTTMLDLVEPEHKDDTENPRRLIVLSEKHGGEMKFLPATYGLYQETPFTFTDDQGLRLRAEPWRHRTSRSSSSTTGSGPTVRPIPVEAGKVNSKKTLTEPLPAVHHRARGMLPNVVRGRLHRDR